MNRVQPESDPSPVGRDSSPTGKRPAWVHLAGLGIELASATLVGLAIGYGIDFAVGGGSNLATAIGLILGFSLGMYRFVRKSMAASSSVAASSTTKVSAAGSSPGNPGRGGGNPESKNTNI